MMSRRPKRHDVFGRCGATRQKQSSDACEHSTSALQAIEVRRGTGDVAQQAQSLRPQGWKTSEIEVATPTARRTRRLQLQGVPATPVVVAVVIV